MIQKFRYFGAFIAMLMLASLLAACGQNAGGTTSDAAAKEPIGGPVNTISCEKSGLDRLLNDVDQFYCTQVQYELAMSAEYPLLQVLDSQEKQVLKAKYKTYSEGQGNLVDIAMGGGIDVVSSSEKGAAGDDKPTGQINNSAFMGAINKIPADQRPSAELTQQMMRDIAASRAKVYSKWEKIWAIDQQRKRHLKDSIGKEIFSRVVQKYAPNGEPFPTNNLALQIAGPGSDNWCTFPQKNVKYAGMVDATPTGCKIMSKLAELYMNQVIITAGTQETYNTGTEQNDLLEDPTPASR